MSRQAELLVRDKRFRGFIMVQHGRNNSKIMECAKALDVEAEVLASNHTEVFISDADRELAEAAMPKKPYGFVHSRTGVKAKNLPDGWGKAWLKRTFGLNAIVEVGVELPEASMPITAQFEIMRNAAAVCVADSVFYHAACALDRRVDLVYFAKGSKVWKRVHAMHPVKECVVYSLEGV